MEEIDERTERQKRERSNKRIRADEKASGKEEKIEYCITLERSLYHLK